MNTFALLGLVTGMYVGTAKRKQDLCKTLRIGDPVIINA